MSEVLSQTSEVLSRTSEVFGYELIAVVVKFGQT